MASSRAATISDQKVKRAAPDSFFSSPSTEPDLLKTSTVSFFLGTGVGISWISRDRADESNYESSAVSSSERRWGEKPIFICINGETGAKERSEAE